MNVAVTGASGFLGRRLTRLLENRGHTVRAVSLREKTVPAEALAGCDGVVHLAGEPIAQRWTGPARQRIVESRVEGTRRLVEAMRVHRPNVLVSASAVGYYGSRGDEVLTEQSSPGSDFLAQTCVAWEREAMEGEKLGARLVRLRFGVVLGSGGGALEKMITPFRLGVGGRLGDGRQWMSWIHVDDLCELILFSLKESTLRGVLNATSPHPVTNAEFTKALGRALHRPAVIPVPGFVLKMVLGEMSTVLLGGQRVIPEGAVKAGFEFRYPDVAAALVDILAV
ncbi:MAG TPA: TIGR01777 family oxidoreductase [Bryobacteraceae bacterium]|jgi:hypothetical protein